MLSSRSCCHKLYKNEFVRRAIIAPSGRFPFLIESEVTKLTLALHKNGARVEAVEQAAPKRSLIELLHRAGQAAEAMHDREIGALGLTARQSTVLQYISAHPDASQTDICNKTGIDRSTLADMVRRLVKKGLVVRRRTRTDARRYALRPTPEGSSALSAAKKATRKTDDKLLASLNSGEREMLVAMLDKLADGR